MTELAYNLNSYYTPNPKAERPENLVVNAPGSVPIVHVYDDIDANKRLKAIDEDIYYGTKQQKNNEKKNFIKIFGGIVLTILGIIGIKSLFK